MSVVRWSPLREFDNLFPNFERHVPAASAQIRRADWMPLVDIREGEKDYQIDIEIPAVAAEDLAVNVVDGVLSVSGERKVSETSEDGRVHRVERHFGKFQRNFQLPDDAEQDSIKARSSDGVLYLTIAKKESSVARAIEIEH